MKCLVCKKDVETTNEVGVCLNCWYANQILKQMGAKGYYDDWNKLKTVDGVEYE